jgi:hypothetical protein
MPVTTRDGVPVVKPPRKDLRNVVLEPGDLLYLPPGTWHETEAREDSVAISVSPPRMPIAAVVLETVRAALERVDDFRRDVLPHPSESTVGPVPASVTGPLAAARHALATWLEALPDAALVQAWASRVYRCGEGRARAEPPTDLRVDDILAHADARGFTYVVAPESPGAASVVFIYRGGDEWVFPAEAEAFVAKLASTPRFRADDALTWDPRLAWDEARDVLAELVAAGILARANAT